MHNRSVDEREYAVGSIVKWMRVEHGNVRILANFKCANAVGDANDLGGVSRYGAQGGFLALLFLLLHRLDAAAILVALERRAYRANRPDLARKIRAAA